MYVPFASARATRPKFDCRDIGFFESLAIAKNPLVCNIYTAVDRQRTNIHEKISACSSLAIFIADIHHRFLLGTMSFATNAFLIDHFLRERDAAGAEGHKGHVIHNNRMAKIIKSLPRDLQSLADLDGIKGVGPKARKTIAALLKERDAQDIVVPATPPVSKPPTPMAPNARSNSAGNDEQRPLKRRRVPRRTLFTASNEQRVSERGTESDEESVDKQVGVEPTPKEHESNASAEISQSLHCDADTVTPGAPLPSLLLAQSFDSDKHSVAGWLWSEKLDGTRAYWDGKALWTRQHNSICAPRWFVDALPAHLPLDGELYAGRGNFQDAVSAVRKHVPIDDEWRRIKFHVFDTPDNGAQPLEARLDAIAQAIGSEHPVVQVVQHQVCESNDHVSQLLERVVAQGGEGLMLRQPRSHYEGKRSKTLLKVKKAHDAEARVEAHEQGKGRNSERLGALYCRMACGKTFKVGSGLTDAVRNNPPPIGSIITYRFNELTRSGVPRFPTFVRVNERTEPSDCVF